MGRTHKLFAFFVTLFLMLYPGTVFCQLADAPWPMFHNNIRHTGKTHNFGTQIGKLKWRFVTSGPVTSSPAIDNNGILYVGSSDNNLYAINTETGALEWKYTTGGPINHSSPAIDKNGIVYIGSYDGYLYAFDTINIDPNNTTYKWKFLTNGPGAIASSPSIADDGTILFGCSDGYLYAVNPDGTEKWKSFIGDTGASPAIDTGLSQVYIGTWKPDEFYGIDLSTGLILWEYTALCGGSFSSPVIASDSSIIFSNFTTYYSDPECTDEMKFQVYNFNPDGTGNWKLDLGENDIYTTSALMEDNTFFIGSGPNLWRILPDGQTYFSQVIDGERIESSPSIDGSKFIFVGTNGGRFYCLHADRPEPDTTIVWQYPPEDEDPLPASIISSPAIGNDERHSVYVGASDGNIYAFFDGPRISGKVELVETTETETIKTPFPSVKMTLGSEFLEEDQVTYTDASGYYEFVGLDNLPYTITPEKPGYVFNPESFSVTIQDEDANNINFEAFIGFTLSGTVRDVAGNSVSGVTITIDGKKTTPKTTQTDSSGAYEFTGLSFDTYTVTPSLDGYGFTPPFQEVTISSDDSEKNKSNIDFEAIEGFQISGQVTDAAMGTGIEGITIKLSGQTADTTETDENGAYSFVGLQNGTYTITPSHSEFDFDPVEQTVTIASNNIDNINFLAATGSSLSGYVTENGAGLADVVVDLISLTKDGTEEIINSVQTDADGFFIFLGIADGSYTIKPSFSAYGFEPLSQKVTIEGEDITNIVFWAIPGYYISGKVTNPIGMPYTGVPLYMDESETTDVYTDEQGQYAFLGLIPGTYTITVGGDGYNSLPASQTVDIVVESKEDIDFILYPTCPVVYLNIPFMGSKGTLVNIYGINFGLAEPSSDLTFDINGTTLEAGVYFGTEDVTTWVKAKVLMWSSIKILAEAPSGQGFFHVWVLNDKGCYFVPAPLSNFFILF